MISPTKKCAPRGTFMDIIALRHKSVPAAEAATIPLEPHQPGGMLPQVKWSSTCSIPRNPLLCQNIHFNLSQDIHFMSRLPLLRRGIHFMARHPLLRRAALASTFCGSSSDAPAFAEP